MAVLVEIPLRSGELQNARHAGNEILADMMFLIQPGKKDESAYGIKKELMHEYLMIII